jgi:hypothetical protein
VQTVPALVPILGVESRPPGDPGAPQESQPLSAWYAGGRVREADGRLRVLPPGTLDAAASRWQAQIGIEIRKR